MVNLANLKEQINWGFRLENEFTNPLRKPGYTFVIDQFESVPRLVLYRIGPFSSHTDPIDFQPPVELIQRALLQQGVTNSEEGLFTINQELRNWIENNIL